VFSKSTWKERRKSNEGRVKRSKCAMHMCVHMLAVRPLNKKNLYSLFVLFGS
jgi:hypothetical protein